LRIYNATPIQTNHQTINSRSINYRLYIRSFRDGDGLPREGNRLSGLRIANYKRKGTFSLYRLHDYTEHIEKNTNWHATASLSTGGLGCSITDCVSLPTASKMILHSKHPFLSDGMHIIALCNGNFIDMRRSIHGTNELDALLISFEREACTDWLVV